jgi:hypothetical protein
MRACSAWPCGVWMDGEKRTVPDGSSFALQHWSHTFEYALAAGEGDWRAAAFPLTGQDYSHQLLALTAGVHGGPLAPAQSLVSVTPAGVDLMTWKPRGYPLAPVRQPVTSDGVTIRLRSLIEPDCEATLRLFTGVAAASVTGLLEQGEGAATDPGAGIVTVTVPPRGTITLAVDPGDLSQAASAPREPASGAPITGPVTTGPVTTGPVTTGPVTRASPTMAPEPAQPIFTRYWLHGKGPAPAGNLPVAVHLSPGLSALAPGEAAAIRLTVACGPDPVSGAVTLGLPAGLRLASVRPAGADRAAGLVTSAGQPSRGPLHYHLDPHGFAAWDLVVQAPDNAPPGRHFVTAMIIDEAGQLLEDAVVVAIVEPQAPRDLTLTELPAVSEAANAAQAAEATLTDLTGDIEVRPGGHAEIAVRLANHTASELRGEAQLISSHGSWKATGPWTMGFATAAGQEATMTFAVDLPADARPGQRWWALVKVMYFGRLRYSTPVWISVVG